MKLQLNNQEILVDFNYTPSTRPCRKGEKDESRKMVRHRFEYSVVQTIVTTCTISFDALNKVTESIKCDAKNHNREFARKYSLQKALKGFTKDFRTEVWKKYFEYLNKDKENFVIEDNESKLEIITYNDFIDLKVDNKLTKSFEFIPINKEDTYKLISVLKKQVKFLK